MLKKLPQNYFYWILYLFATGRRQWSLLYKVFLQSRVCFSTLALWCFDLNCSLLPHIHRRMLSSTSISFHQNGSFCLPVLNWDNQKNVSRYFHMFPVEEDQSENYRSNLSDDIQLRNLFNFNSLTFVVYSTIRLNL